MRKILEQIKWQFARCQAYILGQTLILDKLVKVKVTQSCLTICDPLDCSPWNSPGQNIGAGSLSFLQGISPTQGSNSGLPHCRWVLYQLSHKGSLRIPEGVTYPFSRGSFQPRNQTGVSCMAGRFLTNNLRLSLIKTEQSPSSKDAGIGNIWPRPGKVPRQKYICWSKKSNLGSD